MPSNKVELQQRLALVKPADKVRGLFFNVVFKLVAHHLGDAGVAKVKVGALNNKFSEIGSYPASDFLNLLYSAADVLEAKLGNPSTVFQACGVFGLSEFAESGPGKLVFGILGLGSPVKLFSMAPKAYATVVSYGERTFELLGDREGKFTMKGDLLPPSYHKGILTEALRVVGSKGAVKVTPFELDYVEYLISWE